MAGPAAKQEALAFKERGNKYFQSGQYLDASKEYTKAINKDPQNHLFYTNRAMALLKLRDDDNRHQIIADCMIAIELLPNNFKGYFYLAQAQIESHLETEALESAKKAHQICVNDCGQVPIGKSASNIGVVTELVLRCKKEWWEQREVERARANPGLLAEVSAGLSEDKSEELRRIFEAADAVGKEAKKKVVPDWCIDAITFSVMVDPVMTKTGQSYDRSSIMEHLKRSQTDPLTREPLKVSELRPNLALKEACDQFLTENGWAVDW